MPCERVSRHDSFSSSQFSPATKPVPRQWHRRPLRDLSLRAMAIVSARDTWIATRCVDVSTTTTVRVAIRVRVGTCVSHAGAPIPKSIALATNPTGPDATMHGRKTASLDGLGHSGSIHQIPMCRVHLLAPCTCLLLHLTPRPHFRQTCPTPNPMPGLFSQVPPRDRQSNLVPSPRLALVHQPRDLACTPQPALHL